LLLHRHHRQCHAIALFLSDSIEDDGSSRDTEVEERKSTREEARKGMTKRERRYRKILDKTQQRS